jgi:hypothetical protein
MLGVAQAETSHAEIQQRRLSDVCCAVVVQCVICVGLQCTAKPAINMGTFLQVDRNFLIRLLHTLENERE